MDIRIIHNNNSNELQEIDTKVVVQNQNQDTKVNTYKDVKGKSSQSQTKPNWWCCFIKMLIPISMVVVGSVYFDHKHCPAGEKIALLLILGGVFSFVDCIVTRLAVIKSNPSAVSSKNVRTKTIGTTSSDRLIKVKTTTVVFIEKPPDPDATIITYKNSVMDGTIVVQQVSPGTCALRCLVKLLDLAVFSVFVTTCVYVFRLYQNVDYENSGDTKNYCNKGLYLYAFIYLLVVYFILILLFSICCSYYMCFFCLFKYTRTHNTTDSNSNH